MLRITRQFRAKGRDILRGLVLARVVMRNSLSKGGNSSLVCDAIRNLWFEVDNASKLPDNARQLRELHGKTHLKVHLGCGKDVRVGWVNIDTFLTPVKNSLSDGDTYILQYDLRQPLPFDNECAQTIYSSHFFEHLAPHDGYRLMQDSYRFLEPGGRFRIALPDFQRVFRAYVQGDHTYFQTIIDTQVIPRSLTAHYPDTLMRFLNYAVYQKGEHKCLYDAESLNAILRQIGYSSVIQSEFNPTIDIDLPLRRQYTFYVDAFK